MNTITYYAPGMEKVLVASGILILAYGLFRLWSHRGGAKKSEIRLVSVLPVGQKEKIILCEVRDRRFIMGITQHKISHLYTFDPNVKVTAEPRVTGWAEK